MISTNPAVEIFFPIGITCPSPQIRMVLCMSVETFLDLELTTRVKTCGSGMEKVSVEWIVDWNSSNLHV